jgi:hypothetical protein
MLGWVILLIVLHIVLIVYTMRLAASKGHSALVWGLLEVFFPVIALAVVALMPERRLA